MSFVQQLEKHKLHIKVISVLGNNLLGKLCGKYGQSQQKIISHLKEECRDDRLTVEINFKNNEVVLFATEQQMEKSGIVHKKSLALSCSLKSNKKRLII